MKVVKNWAFLGAAAVVFAGMVAVHAATHRGAPPVGQESMQISRADPSDTAVQARIAAKEGVVQEVIAGRVSLLQAAAAFRALGAQGSAAAMQIAYPLAASEDEAYCRSVIEYLNSQAPGPQGDERACVLEAELYDRLQDGTLHLDDAQADAMATIADASLPRSPSAP